MNDTMPLNKKSAKDLLDQLIITAETYSLSAVIGPEFVLWEQLTAKDSRLPPETINQIKEKCEAAGGWWIWTDGLGGKGDFVSIARWDAIRAEHNLP